MICDFQSSDVGSACAQCGYRLHRTYPEIPSRWCDADKEKKARRVSGKQVAMGLGDLAAEFFALCGVTEERFEAAKRAIYLDPQCGCQDRKKWLNKMGDVLGVNAAAGRMAKWLSDKDGS